MKILIVEDDKNSMKLMLHFFDRFGICDTASDGIEAIAAIMAASKHSQRYDLIILDIMMPNMDGIETLKSIRAYEQQIGVPQDQYLKAIMVSALSGDTVLTEAYQHGCIAFMRKPIDFKRFESIIREEFSLND
jgi:two-component system chemotaxis response regulator CheY